MNYLMLYIKPGAIKDFDLERILDGKESVAIDTGNMVLEFIPEEVFDDGYMSEMKTCQFNVNGEYQQVLTVHEIIEFRELGKTK